MYKVTCDNFTVFETGNPKLVGFNFILTREVNSAGMLSFSIAKNHPYYENVGAGKVIRCYVDNVLKFIGEIESTGQDIYGTQSFVAQGALSKMAVTYQPYAETTNYTVNDYIDQVLENHNSFIEDRWHFTRGTVTVTDPNDNLYRGANYETTKDTISNKLLTSLGGYISCREENGLKFDWKTSGKINNQTIKFGVNIVKALIETRQADVYNVILPLGAKIGDTEERITIKSVNDDSLTIEDADSIATFGRRVLKVVYDDVTEPSNLLTKAYADLEANKFLIISMSLTAFDMSKLNIELNQIDPTDTIKVSIPHLNIDTWAFVQKVVDNGSNPSQSAIYLGEKTKTLTDSKVKADRVYSSIIENYVTNQQMIDKVNASEDKLEPLIQTNSSAINQLSDKIIFEVEEQFATKEEVASTKSVILEQTAENLTITKNSLTTDITNVGNSLTNEIEAREEFIRFDGASMELGQSDSPFGAVLDNTKLAFTENGQTVASVSNQKLNITSADIEVDLQIGNFKWQPRSNGNLSLVWVG